MRRKSGFFSGFRGLIDQARNDFNKKERKANIDKKKRDAFGSYADFQFLRRLIRSIPRYRYFKAATVRFIPKQGFYFSTTLFAPYQKMQRQCNYGSGATNHYNPAKMLCPAPIHRSLVIARHLSLVYSISTTN